MCDLATVATAAVVAGGVTNIIGQNTQRQLVKGLENQKRLAREEQINTNRLRATEDYIAKVADERALQGEQEAVVAEKTFDVQRSERKAAATATVAAAEAGVTGNNLTALMQDYRMQADRETSRLRISQDFANRQHERNVKAYGREFQNRVESIQPYAMQPQAPVDYFGPIFGTIGGVAQVGMAANKPGR